MDIFVLKAITEELKDQLVSSRVSKVYQINADDLVIQFWGRGEKRLYISIHPEMGHLCLIERKPSYPPVPPRFAAFLRSHLSGSKLVDLRVVPFDRVATLDFQRKGSEGTTETLYLIVELLGRHGNVIVTDGDHSILEALRHVSARESNIRQILPGERYRPLPPLPYRLSLANLNREELWKRLMAGLGGREDISFSLPRQLQQLIGLGSTLARELALRVGGKISISGFETLWTALEGLRSCYQEGFFVPQVLQLNEGDETLSAFDLPHLPVVSRQVFQEMNRAAEVFYQPRIERRVFREIKRNLLRSLEKGKNRLIRKKQNLGGDRRKLEGYLKLKEYADLLISQQVLVSRSAPSVRLINYYSLEMEEIEVPLDVRFSPKGNAEVYYKKYRKARKGLDVVVDFLNRVEADLRYLEDLIYQSEEVDNLDTLFPLAEEAEEALGNRVSAGTGRQLSEGRKRLGAKAQRGREEEKERREDQVSQWCRRFFSSEGWEILCGKNSRGNDWLLKRIAQSEDIWLHAHRLPGTHVLLKRRFAGGIPERTLLEAAQIAAYFSRGKGSTKVSVIYTPAKNVRKLQKGKPGQVTVEKYQTILVQPERGGSEE